MFQVFPNGSVFDIHSFHSDDQYRFKLINDVIALYKFLDIAQN